MKNTKLITFRIGVELLARVDERRAQLEAELPRLKITRSEVLRQLLEDWSGPMNLNQRQRPIEIKGDSSSAVERLRREIEQDENLGHVLAWARVEVIRVEDGSVTLERSGRTLKIGGRAKTIRQACNYTWFGGS